ncbi:unnamed protein product [Urochloa decumbens]|uniref:Uncharacterized protein n=1 Tax=Urochloa decumbens TaxID=240449 RepID=A0ABC8VXE2_9POAL
MAREGAAQGPSPAAPAAGMGRLMHTGANLPFWRQALSQQRKIVRTEQSSSSRSYTGGPGDLTPPHFSALAVVCALALGAAIPNSNIVKRIKKRFKEE